MRTIGTVLNERKGIGPGFDFLRIFLALSVLCTHSFLIAEGEQHQFAHPPLQLFHASILPWFFALSGFLITGSAQRLTLKNFLLNRGLRIVPALAVDITVAALTIGPLFTVLPLNEYFSAYEFRAYFANVFGLIHYVLPGVFDGNPFPSTVNGSLWTVPFEIGCYVIMSASIYFGLLKRRWVFLLLALAISGYIAYDYAANPEILRSIGITNKAIFTAFAHYWSTRGNDLYVYFLLGSAFYLFRDLIPYKLPLFLVSMALFIAGSLEAFSFVSGSTQKLILAPILVYILTYIGLTSFPKIPLYSRGDYSYGIYLYGFPLQQALVALFPSMKLPWLNMACSIILVTLVAMLSWHFVEKPILKIRKKFSFTARKGDLIEACVRDRMTQISIAAHPKAVAGSPAAE